MLKKMIIGLILIITVIGVLIYIKVANIPITKEEFKKGYISSDTAEVTLYEKIKNEDKTEYKKLNNKPRGIKIYITKRESKDNYLKIKLDKNIYYIKKENITYDKENIVKESKIYVRTSNVLYNYPNNIKIKKSVKKGEELIVTGYDKIVEGKVNMYKTDNGYIYGKYVTLTKEESLLHYNQNGIYDKHKNRLDKYGGGSATNLDYYPIEKETFKDNIMPKETRTIYLTVEALKNVDKYITFAKNNNINAFVVDVKENTVPGYKSEIMKEYSKTSYERAVLTEEQYKSYIDKIKENGIYVIGRITTFKDNYYAKDHPENTIKNTSNNQSFIHNGSAWPTAYNRKVWEYNVALAYEAATVIGFNEIQFDYVRFPDRVYNLEKNKQIDLQNTYNEDKAAAIQQFLMYAKDVLHSANTYLSADVFGETSNNYVTAYGQYWPAISNVVDVVSAMPYPDHFNKYEYGIKVPVWTVPYQLLNKWGTDANVRQSEIETPAVVRTWIQAYNTIKEPFVTYNSQKIEEQIKGLYDAGLTGGYITWNSSSNLDKYYSLAPAFRKDLINE